MKKAGVITLNNFTLIPVSRFIIELLSKRFKLFIGECYIKGSYRFDSYGETELFCTFNNRPAFLKQPIYKKILKYFNLYRHLFYLVFIKRVDLIYTPDLQVLSAVFRIKRLSGRTFHIIYHQFELLDPSSFTKSEQKLWRELRKEMPNINLCIFPEENRMRFFCENVGFDITKCLIFPNTCIVDGDITTPPEELKDIPRGDLIVAHVGNAGANHYLGDFIRLVNAMSEERNIHFLMIGGLSPEVLSNVDTIVNKNFHFIGQLSHKQLANYYRFIDIGFILYKGLDLNLEYCAPNKLYEYWSYGIYVFAYPLKGLISVFDDGRMGVLIDLEDVKKVYKAILAFKNGDRIREREYIKGKFKENYSIESYINQLSKILDEFA